jgi:hypothetical protein
MSRPASLLDFVTRSRWFQRDGLRRLTFAVAIIVLAVLSVFPRPYAAVVQLAPQESNTAGLSAILSQLGGNYAALMGRSQPVEVDLAIARSFDVKRSIVRDLGERSPEGSADLASAIRDLEDRTKVQAMRGNLMEIVVRGHNADEALNISRVYAATLQKRLAALSRESTTRKRGILNQRFTEAQNRLTAAEAAVSQFRRENQLVEPESQLSSAVDRLSTLQGQLQAKQVQLQTTLQFNTPEHPTARALQAELRALQEQVNIADQQVRANGGLTASGIAPKALQYERLNRELKFSQALFDSYTRYLEGAAIEDLTAEYNVQLIEPPHISSDRQFNMLPLAALVLVLLLALTSEFIAMRPPPGAYFQQSKA